MNDLASPLTVDADGHVLEPVDTWERYIDPAFRDRALRVGIDDDGFENLFIDGRPTMMLKGRLGALGGIEAEGDEKLAFQTPGNRTYAEGAPEGGYDPAARLAVLDSEGIDQVLLYPTIGIAWEGSVRDPELATAYARAYNRWIVDFCSAAPKPLFPVAHISLIDEVGAVAEVQRARAAGCVGVYLSPDLPARGGRSLADPAFDRFWATVQDLEMPIAFHVVARENSTFVRWSQLPDGRADGVFAFAFLAIEVMAAFTQLVTTGVLERYPRLKCSVLEAGSNWICAWLDRLDHKFEMGGFETPMKQKPSDYFRRQCVISADPDETLTAPVVEHLGADYCIWASDYPHLDASMGVVAEIRERLATLPLETQRKVLGGNAAKFYGIGD